MGALRDAMGAPWARHVHTKGRHGCTMARHGCAKGHESGKCFAMEMDFKRCK